MNNKKNKMNLEHTSTKGPVIKPKKISNYERFLK